MSRIRKLIESLNIGDTLINIDSYFIGNDNTVSIESGVTSRHTTFNNNNLSSTILLPAYSNYRIHEYQINSYIVKDNVKFELVQVLFRDGYDIGRYKIQSEIRINNQTVSNLVYPIIPEKFSDFISWLSNKLDSIEFEGDFNFNNYDRFHLSIRNGIEFKFWFNQRTDFTLNQQEAYTILNNFSILKSKVDVNPSIYNDYRKNW